MSTPTPPCGSSAVFAASLVDCVSPNATERTITVDQTNRSVIVGEQVIVKWLLRPMPYDKTGAQVMQHLNEVGFQQMPTFYGIHEDKGLVLATASEYVPGSSDGWTWCTDDLQDVVDGIESRESFIASVAELGTLAADLHCALVSDSSTIPMPIHEGLLAPWHDHAASLLERALAVTDQDAQATLSTCLPQVEAAVQELCAIESTMLQAVHGDLHVGQVLRADGQHFLVDFDGNPLALRGTEQRAAPAASDLAALMQSIDHVGRVAVKRRHDSGLPVDKAANRIEQIVNDAIAALLTNYRSGLAEAGRSALLDDRLLGPLRVLQELHEMVYADLHLPRWMYVPIAALPALFQTSTVLNDPKDDR